MRLSKYVASSAGAVAALGLLLLAPTRGFAQTVSPCCAQVCNPDGSSDACSPLLLGGLGNAVPSQALARGCVDVETAPPGSVCLGGAVLQSAPPALIDGCLCVFGGTAGSGQCVDIPSGATLSPSDCAKRSVKACGGNVTHTASDATCGTCSPPVTCGPDDTNCGGVCVDTANDPANCGSCGHVCPSGQTCVSGSCQPGTSCGNGSCDAGAGENCETCPQDCACTGGETCQNGTCAPPPTCSPEGGACVKKSDCCEPLNCVDAGQQDRTKVCAPSNKGQPGG
jgi:Stigma-specific protein, Stig1